MGKRLDASPLVNSILPTQISMKIQPKEARQVIQECEDITSFQGPMPGFPEDRSYFF